MKNSINLVLAIFVFIVLGCTCNTSGGFKSGDSGDEKKSDSKPAEKSDIKTEPFETKKDSNENKIESKDDDDALSDLEKKLEDLKKDSNGSNKNSSKDSKEDSDSLDDSKENNGQIPTMSQFTKIEQGMSYDEVVDIIGFEGKLFKTDRYLWGDNNRFIMISFQNDKVMMATQNGLK